MTDIELKAWIQEQLENAYLKWEKGAYYKYNGDYYDVETGEFICPCE